MALSEATHPVEKLSPAESGARREGSRQNVGDIELAVVGLQERDDSSRIETILEFTTCGGLKPQVIREQNVIRGVKILGLESRNGRIYPPASIEKALGLYEGVKVNVNHPKGGLAAPRDYQDRLGFLKNVRADTRGVFADLHYNPKHAIAEQLIWDAENAPENVGLSHNAQARTSRRDGQVVVEEILKVNSVDLVADPATTSSLFESHGRAAASVEHHALCVESLRRDHPQLVEEILADGASELASLRRRIAEYELQQETVAKIARIDAIVEESGMRPSDMSDVFHQQLVEADLTTARRLVEERAALLAAGGSRSRPRSKGPLPEEPFQGDIQRWARAIT